jgi:hypothetical protein
MSALPLPDHQTVEAIWRSYEEDAESGFRYHLGASLIGKECDRALWYDFRWATRAKFAGRMLRLFETGQLEEARFVANLRRAGVEVYDCDETKPADPITGKHPQISVRNEFGHFGGSLDGVGIGFLEAPKKWHVIEFKTHSEKSFKALVENGVQKSKPRHYAQMQVYMHLIGMDRAYYLAKNKNNDDLYSERIEYDMTFALRLLAKADSVIQSPELPRRISHDPSWAGCKGYANGAYRCEHYDICHGGVLPERHCRSCMHSTPCQGGVWHCAQAYEVGSDPELSREQQEAGCTDHRYIPGLIHGQQTGYDGDLSDGTFSITYEFPGGETWVDAGPEQVATSLFEPERNLNPGESIVNGVLHGWTGNKCPKCNGIGDATEGTPCTACGGTGDEYGPLGSA